MSSLVISNKSILPDELILKIIYEFQGLEHKTSQLIKKHINNYSKEKVCWYCRKRNVGLSKCKLSYLSNNTILQFQKTIIENEKPEKIYLCYACAH
tara:strand:- start:87 stop:374 length:288 start_codon:yes stop_codon:yes gene_type:complete